MRIEDAIDREKQRIDHCNKMLNLAVQNKDERLIESSLKAYERSMYTLGILEELNR